MQPSQLTPVSVSDNFRGSNQVGLGQFNERLILQAVRQHGAIAKADLARLTQLSTQAVSVIADRLIEQGLLLRTAPTREGRVGQPPVPLRLNPSGAFSIGIQVGLRSLEVVHSDFVGQIQHHYVHHYDFPDPAQVLKHIQQGLHAVRTQASFEQWAHTVGVGLAAPLRVHDWTDALWTSAKPALEQWRDFSLKEQVEKMVDLPVYFVKDTAAGCVAELELGRGREVNNFLYIYCGTFVGGAVVLGGRMLWGKSGNAGAIGSCALSVSANEDASPQTKDKESVPQLLQVASGLQLGMALERKGHQVSLIYEDSVMSEEYSAQVNRWCLRASTALAMSIANSTALLDLEAVVIDGVLAPSLMQRLVHQTEAQLENYSFKGMEKPEILRGLMGEHARALGAALLPLQVHYFPDKDLFLIP